MDSLGVLITAFKFKYIPSHATGGPTLFSISNTCAVCSRCYRPLFNQQILMKRVTIGYKSFLCKVAKYVISSSQSSLQLYFDMLSCVTVVRMLTIETRGTGQGETGSSLFTGYKSGVQSQDRRRMWCGRGRTVHSQCFRFSKFICILYPAYVAHRLSQPKTQEACRHSIFSTIYENEWSEIS